MGSIEAGLCLDGQPGREPDWCARMRKRLLVIVAPVLKLGEEKLYGFNREKILGMVK